MSKFSLKKLKHIGPNIKKWYHARKAKNFLSQFENEAIEFNIDALDTLGARNNKKNDIDIDKCADELAFINCGTCNKKIKFSRLYIGTVETQNDKYYYCQDKCKGKDCEDCYKIRPEQPYCRSCREVSYPNLKTENATLKQKLAELETHVKYMPGGIGFEEAKESFEKCV